MAFAVVDPRAAGAAVMPCEGTETPGAVPVSGLWPAVALERGGHPARETSTAGVRIERIDLLLLITVGAAW